MKTSSIFSISPEMETLTHPAEQQEQQVEENQEQNVAEQGEGEEIGQEAEVEEVKEEPIEEDESVETGNKTAQCVPKWSSLTCKVR